jgi:hypothetical protein
MDGPTRMNLHRFASVLFLGVVAILPGHFLSPFAGVFLAASTVLYFWWAHAFQMRAINWKFLLGFGTASVVGWLLLRGTGVTGLPSNLDFDPTRISALKRSQRVALRLYFDHEPTPDERYLKLGFQPGLPESTGDSRAREWAHHELRRLPFESKLTRIQEWFGSSFRYSLDSRWKDLDDFLFDSQEGYCMHFSYAVEALTRISGERARIAYGYSGGTWNPVLRILTFRDEDAHSWIEIFNPATRTWTRVDPTSWVLRLKPGMDAEVSSSSIEWIDALSGFGMLIFLAILGLMVREPRVQLNAILKDPAPLALTLSRMARTHPALMPVCESLATHYERLTFSPRPTLGDSLLVRLHLLQLRWLGWKYLSRAKRGQSSD